MIKKIKSLLSYFFKFLFLSCLYPVPILFLSCLFVFANATIAVADDVTVDSVIDQSGGIWENQPLKGLISITHPAAAVVDESSFKLGNAPLTVEFVQDVKLSNQLVLSYYKFNIEGKPKGLQILPSVTVKVGNKEYVSPQSTYQVGAVAAAVAPAEKAGGKSILKLESSLRGPAEIYPGTRFKVVYHYIFNDSIELLNETLPLLEGTGFLKIGTQEVKDSEEGEYSIREISQELEAVKPGLYKFDGAQIKGYAYRNDPFGGHIYIKPMLNATTAPMSITVQAFPDKGKPASFNGAIGPFSEFTASLKSSSKISVGDKIVLNLKLTGKGQLAKAPLPELCCQPGFSGIFSLSDLPPLEKVQGSTKLFTVEMRPLSPLKAIPSIEFSYFLPASKTYEALHSAPIPLTVEALPAAPVPSPEEPDKSAKKEEDSKLQDWRKLPNTVVPIEITGIDKLTAGDMKNRFFGMWWVLGLIPFGVAVVIGQLLLQNYLKKHKGAVKPKKSQDIFEEAMRAGTESPLFYQLLCKAFILRLAEKGLVESDSLDPENLPAAGKAGEVRDFLLKIAEKRFTGQKSVFDDETIKQAKNLFAVLR